MEHGFPEGQYFYIRREKLVIDVYMGELTPNSDIIVWTKKTTDDKDNQLWSYEDGFLTNKKSGLVMDIRGGDLKSDSSIIQYDRKVAMAHNQRFGFRDGYIYCLADPRLTLGVKNGNWKDGSKIILCQKDMSGSATKGRWVLDFDEKMPPKKETPHYPSSSYNSNEERSVNSGYGRPNTENNSSYNNYA